MSPPRGPQTFLFVHLCSEMKVQKSTAKLSSMTMARNGLNKLKFGRIKPVLIFGLRLTIRFLKQHVRKPGNTTIRRTRELDTTFQLLEQGGSTIRLPIQN